MSRQKLFSQNVKKQIFSISSCAVIGSLAIIIAFVQLSALFIASFHRLYGANFVMHARYKGLVIFIERFTASLFFYAGYPVFLYSLFLFFAGFVVYKKLFTGRHGKQLLGLALTAVGASLIGSHADFHYNYPFKAGLFGDHLYDTIISYYHGKLLVPLLFFLMAIGLCLAVRISVRRVAVQILNAVHYFFSQWRAWLLPVPQVFYALIVLSVYPLYALLLKSIDLLRGAPLKKLDESLVGFEKSSVITYEEDSFWKSYFGGNTKVLENKSSPEIEEVTIKKKLFSATPAHTEQKKTVSKVRYKVPQEILFEASLKKNYTEVDQDHETDARTLEEKLECFGIEGKVTAIKPGPVITLFEYEPSIDAKVSKIIALQDDLTLALEALSVRVVAPIPGTSRVGFEVSNKKRHAVFMRDIVRSDDFKKSTAALPIILGHDTSGANVIVDLAQMPHLLVAGSTGSGKSVGLNTLLISLLCRFSPQELKLIIIDPKRLEFAGYHDIAHLLFPIITESHKAAPVLRWLVKTMETRYSIMAEKGIRNIGDYKAQCKKNGDVDEMPYIVLIIDELADLMMVARKEVEVSIARLAQMARASGIHMVLATQRPSVDVLTGVIKVNFPSRISFRVTSKIDSRTVLDTFGAETLLGKGDMLFMDAHSAYLKRAHGAYVTDKEINAIVENIRAQQKVEYIDLQEALAATEKNEGVSDEPLLKEIAIFLETVSEISISLLQRRFKIGYNRSARIMEDLEAQGKIMPFDGSKMRKVIK